MRHLIGLGCLAALLSGCLAEVLTTTAITAELQAEQMKAMNGQVQRAADTTAKINLQKGIDTYRAEKGANPPSLVALVPDYLPAIPTASDGNPYGYDATNGALLDGASAIAAADQRKLEQVKAAITQYGSKTGFYPVTLDALAPAYLPTPPQSVTGQAFVYDNRTGYLAVPGGGQAASGRAAGVSGAGGPMGEAMTGIAIQNQLNSNSNAGSASAGSFGRDAIGNAVGGHNASQEAAMDRLGL